MKGSTHCFLCCAVIAWQNYFLNEIRGQEGWGYLGSYFGIALRASIVGYQKGNWHLELSMLSTFCPQWSMFCPCQTMFCPHQSRFTHILSMLSTFVHTCPCFVHTCPPLNMDKWLSTLFHNHFCTDKSSQWQSVEQQCLHLCVSVCLIEQFHMEAMTCDPNGQIDVWTFDIDVSLLNVNQCKQCDTNFKE